MIRLAVGHPMDEKELRAAYCAAMMEAASKEARLVTVDCDLCSSMGMTAFGKEFPQRAFNIGIQEANAVGVAAGLSAVGFIPFFHSFAVFASRRVFDQVFLSCGYAGRNVKIVGGDAGVSATINGGTHMAFEDMGVMRLIPGATVIDICDAAQLCAVLPQIVAHSGVDYIRMPRKQTRRIYEDGSEITVGKANVLREGAEVTLIASGLLVYEALMAAEQLAQEGIEARVVDMFTVKPLDEACVLESAAKTGAIVTAENHNVIGGLGSAVSELLAEQAPCPIERIGVRESFGEVGPQDYLMQRFGLTAADICKAAKRVIARK